MNILELNHRLPEIPRNYVVAAIARRHRVSLPAAELIAELLGKSPVEDNWTPLAVPATSIVGRVALSLKAGERA